MKEFIIFKNDYKTEGSKQPDFKLMAKVGDNLEQVGAGWNRKTDKGKPMISCVLSKPYQDKKGYHLEVDTEEVKEDLDVL